ncbi:MAG TPA: peptidoglycan-binding domain-containing protein [Alphaproteobacteria bacterium]|nr:peptidoglycan-binding domain-containing protein [Alphaproteobacteria bacterium]
MTRAIPTLAAALLVATSVGAFAATPATQPTTANTAKSQASLPSTEHHMSARRVEEIQAALQSRGEHVSTDGIWGPKTVQAMKDFQKKNGLKPTGRYDQATAQKLDIQHWS